MCELCESEDLLKTIRKCNKICLNKNNNYTVLIQNDVWRKITKNHE